MKDDPVEAEKQVILPRSSLILHRPLQEMRIP
jgi:hypothetical protein